MKVNKEKRGFGAEWVEVVVDNGEFLTIYSLLEKLFEICFFVVFLEIPKIRKKMRNVWEFTRLNSINALFRRYNSHTILISKTTSAKVQEKRGSCWGHIFVAFEVVAVGEVLDRDVPQLRGS